MKALVVIPAYNEAAHIAATVRAARRYLPVLVVDDGSTDGTAGLAAAAGAQVLRQVPNQGKGAALRAGFDRALALGVEFVIMLDADGQHDPREIPIFQQAQAEQPVDLLVGRRAFRHMPPARRLANTLGQWLFSWALGRFVPDNQSGYRLLSRRFMQALRASPERGFEFEVEMFTVCVTGGYALGWVPIRTIYGDERSHIRPLQHAANFMRLVWHTRQRLRAAQWAA